VPGWPQAAHAGQQQLASNYTLLNLHHTQHTEHATSDRKAPYSLRFRVLAKPLVSALRCKVK
jgi:hypothetical protein